MNFLKLDRPCVLAFLSIAIATGEPSSGVPSQVHDDPPFWQFVLREFVFKTVSGPPPNDEALYQKLLDAPFYGGPPPVAANGESSLVSRGDVHRTPDGGWILCQEGCVDCDPCGRQRDPIVKWILRRVMRPRSRSKSPKWDLRLTVFPRSRAGNEASYDAAFVRSRDELGRETILRDSGPETRSDLMRSQDELGRESILRDSGPGTTVGLTRSQDELGRETILRGSGPETTSGLARSHDELGRETILRDSGLGTRSDLLRSEWSNEETRGSGESNIGRAGHSEDSPVSERRSTGRTRVKRYRVRPSGHPGHLRFYDPQEDVTGSNGPAEGSDESTPRLIMGIDQHGEKHLVHVVPVDPPANERDSMSYRSSYRTDNAARIGRTAQQGRDGLSYEKLIDRIMSSLNSHRGFIEKFIFSDRLEPEYKKGAVHPSYAFSDPQRASDDDGFDGRNFDDYRVGASPGVTQYPTDSGYQTHERDDRFKGRYADTEREVNKPSGEYQDQTIEYEPYVTSADGRQDDRSLAPTDGERRRRNLAPKVVALTDDPQGLGQNRTEIHTPDPKFPTNRQLPGNSTDRELTDSRSGINETGAAMDNLPGQRSNEKTSTVEETGRIPTDAG